MKYLKDVETANSPGPLVQYNFEQIEGAAFGLSPSTIDGVSTAIIGPPTASEGAFTSGDTWVDAAKATWLCTASGTPGTWSQIRPAPVSGSDPASYPDAYLIARTDAGGLVKVYDNANTVWRYVFRPTNAASMNLSGAAVDWSLGEVFHKTLSANTTFTFSKDWEGQQIQVLLTNTASNYTVTWPGAVKWPGNVAPVQTVGAKKDLYTFRKVNGVIYGSVVQNYS